MAQIAVEQAEAAEAAPAHANPAPLGLSGFAVTTFILSIVNAGLVPVTDATFLSLAVAFGGLAQLLAGMWAFKARNTFAATAFSTYGAFWLSLAVGVLTKTLVVGSVGFSWYLLIWGILTFVYLIAALKTNGALIAVLFFLTITYLALAIGGFAVSKTWIGIGGWLGIITAILAEYTALADLLAEGTSFFKLPTFPMS
jgi:uncharacterized protein